MSLFNKKKKTVKKEKTETTDVMITSNTSQERKSELNELKVELSKRNYVIFSGFTKKYLCLNNDFNNSISFDDYENSIQDTILLKKENLYALLYFNYATGLYESTDFIFASIKKEKHLLLLTTSDNKKCIYCYYALYNEICDYIIYDMNEGSDIFLFKFADHDELYKRYFSLRLDLLFSGKDITLCKTLNKLSYGQKSIFSYKIDNSNLMNYFIIDTDDISDVENKNNYTSLDIAQYDEHNIAIIGKNEQGKECVFDMYTPHITSKYYDSIKNTKHLFLCQEGNHVEIIDIDSTLYYENDFESDVDLSLVYNEISDSFILSNNNSKIMSLCFYDDFSDHFYGVFEANNEYGTFYSLQSHLCIPNFVKKHKQFIYEFEDGYFVTKNKYYLFFDKAAMQYDTNDLSLTSKYLKTIYFDDDKNIFELGRDYISILEKCDINELYSIDDIYFSDNNDIVIKANNRIFDVTISGDKLKVEVITGEDFEINVSDIQTNLTDYIFERINSKFSITYLKYLLN